MSGHTGGDPEDPEGPSSGENQEVAPTGDDLHEAFGLVASEARFDILRALWDETKGDDAVQFSTLRERTGIRDSGQFNYHLDKLQPRFVRNVEDGYTLSYAGKQVIGAAVSGVYTDADATAIGTMTVGDCPMCDGTMTAEYETGTVDIGCAECDLMLSEGMAAPPVIAATHDEANLPKVLSRHLMNELESLNNGFCQLCGGGIDRLLDVPAVSDGEPDASSERGDAPEGDETGDRSEDDDHLNIRWECRACGNETRGTVGSVIITDPLVPAFLIEHGIDVRERPVWELDWLFDGDAELRETDPVRVEATVSVDDERLVLTLNENLDVVESTRERI